MKRIALILAALLAPTLAWAQNSAPAPADAPAAQPASEAAEAPKASQTRQIRERDQLIAEPRQSYIFFRTARKMGFAFLREAGAAAELAELEAARGMAQERYQQDMATWRRIEAACRGDGAAAYRCRRPRPQPDPPSEGSAFSFLAPERNIHGVDRNGTFTDADGSYTYLLAVPAGSYVFYGQRDINGTIYTGVCLCMGSVRFEVGEGQVVDLGTITYPGLDAAGTRNARNAATTTMENSVVLVPPQAGAALPARLSGLTVVPVVLRAADKQTNLLGLYVDRHPAIAGVLRYQRDEVIDERTGQAPASLP